MQTFYSYFWASLFIFWCFLTDFLQNFNNSSLSLLVHYYAQIYARLQPSFSFLLCILHTDLSASVTYWLCKFSQEPHESPGYLSKLILHFIPFPLLSLSESRHMSSSISFTLGIKQDSTTFLCDICEWCYMSQHLEYFV